MNVKNSGFPHSTLRVNLHVHSAFSDGLFTPKALAIQAIEKGLSILGISDHYNTSKTGSIDPDRLEAYLDDLDSVADRFKSQIRILKAIEIDTIDMFVMGKELPPQRLLDRLDYALLEYVANIPRAGIPILHASFIAQELPVPTGLAHTDLAMAFPGMEPDELIEKLISADLFIELNETYCRPGERHPFYIHYRPYLESAETKPIKFSVGTDAHGPIVGPARHALEFLKTFHLENRLFCLP